LGLANNKKTPKTIDCTSTAPSLSLSLSLWTMTGTKAAAEQRVDGAPPEGPLYARLCGGVTEEAKRVAAPALQVFRERHGVELDLDDASWVRLVFPNVAAARAFVFRGSGQFSDRGQLVGVEDDSLVRAVPMMRMNEGLYHLVLYALENKLMYDAPNDTWHLLDEVQPQGKRDAIFGYLDKYMLRTTASWDAFQACTPCAICASNKCSRTGAHPQLCLACEARLGQLLDQA
jgi:hypothetical protein